jgi:hypothetical protein
LQAHAIFYKNLKKNMSEISTFDFAF